MELTLSHLTLKGLGEMLESPLVELSDDCKNLIQKCRTYLDQKVEDSAAPIYGVNTGFGSLCDVSIGSEDLAQLQTNLVRSHACGTGDEVPAQIVRLMLLLKARGLSYGHSGAAVTTVQRLLALYNTNTLPVVYTQGSLGASGDLAPLAHIAMSLIGEGHVRDINGQLRETSEVQNENGWQPLALQSKEGLALLNGTQFMSAYASWCVMECQRLLEWANALGALSLESFDGRREPFIDAVHQVRNHEGQIHVASEIRSWLEGSELIDRPKVHVQDPYSFRCMPQVHGASWDVFNHIAHVVENEINAVTDNPTIFPELDLVVSAGNFHGQPMALALDQMAIAIAEIGSISERRVYKLISGQRDLPPFLVKKPGLNSGFMIPQYTAASIVSANKMLCMPNSVDTIDSSNGQEDHVSMGANAAVKCYKVVNNVRSILAIELMNAAQAIEFRRPARTSSRLEKLLDDYRSNVEFVEDDEYLHPIIRKAESFLKDNSASSY